MAKTTTPDPKKGTTMPTKREAKSGHKAPKAGGKPSVKKAAAPVKSVAKKVVKKAAKKVAKKATVSMKKVAATAVVAPKKSTVVAPNLSDIREIVSLFETKAQPAHDAIVARAGEVLGRETGERIRRIGSAMDDGAKKALFFFEQAAVLVGTEREGEVEGLTLLGVAKLAEALAHQSSLGTELALQALFGLQTPAGVLPEKLRTFQLAAPAYFPKLIHTIATLMRGRIGSQVSDGEVLINTALFALANMDQFCSEPYIAKKFTAAGAGRVTPSAK